jgi:Fe-S-cluster-containing dehydrogenase component
MSMDRRSLLKGLAAVGAGAAVTPASATASDAPRPPEDAYGMLYDATRCIGCRACVAACKKANKLGSIYEIPDDLDGYTKNIIKRYQADGEYSNMKQQCMHCIDPACVNACMIGALKKRELGIVTWDPGRCIGCRYCQVACPYTVPKFQWDTPNPRIVKCELCNHIIYDPATGKVREGTQTACCQACPKQAVIFGKYEDLLAEAKNRIAAHPDRYYPKGKPKVYGEHDGGGTQVLYLAGVDFAKLGLPDLGDKGPGYLPRTLQHSLYQGFITPAVLYAALGGVLFVNRRRSAGKEEE